MGATTRTDGAFNALHGRFGEDGCVQGVLDILDIPYTHSGLLASALAMNKPMAKRLFADAGIPLPEHKIATADEIMAGDVMERPYVVKPLNEGSSVGVHIVMEGDNEPVFGDSGWPFGNRRRASAVAARFDRPSVARLELEPSQLAIPSRWRS